MSNHDGKGYLVPDPIDPGELVCFRVYVPAHTWYLGAFWQAYEFFTAWLAWARDPLHRGKQAAAVWRRAFDLARAEYLTGRGCELNVTGIRQNPLNPCELQASFDGGAAWVTVADLSKCGGCNGANSVMRVVGNQIQFYDDCAEEWISNGQAGDPAADGDLTAKYPGDENGQCLAAANVGQVLQDNTHEFFKAYASGTGVGGLLAKIVSFIALLVPGFQEFGGIIATITLLADQLISFYEDASEADYLDELITLIMPYFDSDGGITFVNWTALVAAINARKGDPPVTLDVEYAYWSVVALQATLLGPVGMVNASIAGGITEYDCGDAEWIQVFDFGESNQAFSRAQSLGVYLGVYEPEVGWQATPIVNAGGRFTVGLFQRGATPATVTSVTVEYDAVIGTILAGTHAAIRLWDFPFHDGDTAIDDFTIITGDDQLHVFNMTETLSGICVELYVGADILANPAPGGSGTIKRLTLRGTGLNPYA